MELRAAKPNFHRGRLAPALESRGASKPRTRRALIRSGAATGGDRVSAER